MQRARRAPAAVAVLVAAGLLGGSAMELVIGERGPAAAAAVGVAPEELSAAFRRATERVAPAVVYVRVEGRGLAQLEVPQPFRGTPWEDLFRQGQPRALPRQASGSGIIIRQDGYILTNNHVVQDAERITVVLADRREFDATIVGRDPNTDVAVVKVEARGLPVAPLGDSDAVEVGDWVVALGYPLHLGSTATAGIVSAKGRSPGVIGRNDEASAPLEDFIQTDAAINPGNSGGPLVNLRGEVIGVNTAIASPTGYYSGYGFAVPVGLARRVAEDLIEHGAVRRPKLGAQIADVDPADAEVYGLDRPTGVEVVRVEPAGPGARAGLRLGDVIVGVEGQEVESTSQLMELLARHDPGDTVMLDVVRYGKSARVSVRLGEFDAAVQETVKARPAQRPGLERLGFRALELTAAQARRMGYAGPGVVVSSVDETGAAARAGLAPGMRIESLNGRSIERLDDLRKAAAGVRPGQAVSLVVRAGDEAPLIINYRVRE
ncbi:MAG TPA: trypsin-like peptidase domain-containing protein [Longimicrobiales bacterium]